MMLKWTKIRVLRCHKDISPSRGYSRPWVEPEAPTGLDAEAGEPTGQNTPQPTKLTAWDTGVPSESDIALDERIKALMAAKPIGAGGVCLKGRPKPIRPARGVPAGGNPTGAGAPSHGAWQPFL